MTRRVPIPHLIMVTLATGAAAKGAEISTTLDAAASVAAVTNPGLQAGVHDSDDMTSATAEGALNAADERQNVSVAPRYASTRYRRDHSLDVDSGAIDIESARQLERGQWTLGASGTSDTTLTSEQGLSGITTVNQRHEYLDLHSGFQRRSSERLSWSADGSWSATRYPGSQQYGLSNYRYVTLQGGPTWNLSELTQGSLIASANLMASSGSTQRRDYSLSGRVNSSATELSAWHLQAGVTRVDLGDGFANSLLLEAGLSGHGEHTTWDGTLRRAVDPIGVGLFARSDSASLSLSATVSEHGTVDVSLAARRSAPVSGQGATGYNGAWWGQLSADWRWQFARQWIATVSGIRSRARTGDAGAWAEGNQLGISVRWQSDRL